MTTKTAETIETVMDAEFHQLAYTSVYRIGETFYNVHTSRFGSTGHQVLGQQVGRCLRMVLTPDAANIMWTDAWFIATGLHTTYRDDNEVRDEARHACAVFTAVYRHTTRYDGHAA